MIRRPQKPSLSDTCFPYPTLFRSRGFDACRCAELLPSGINPLIDAARRYAKNSRNFLRLKVLADELQSFGLLFRQGVCSAHGRPPSDSKLNPLVSSLFANFRLAIVLRCLSHIAWHPEERRAARQAVSRSISASSAMPPSPCG